MYNIIEQLNKILTSCDQLLLTDCVCAASRGLMLAIACGFLVFSCRPIPPKLLCNSWTWIGELIPEIWSFEIFQDSGFGPTGSRSVWSADLKPYPRTKYEVDQTTRCRDMAPFEVLQNARSVGRSVGRRSLIYTLFSCTPLRYVRKRSARGVNKKAQLSLTNPRDACEKFARFT